MIRIGLVEGNNLVRSGRAMVISSQSDLKLVFEESDPQKALIRAPEYLVDVLVVSQNQHGFSGTSYVSELVGVLKSRGNTAEVLVTTPFFSDQLRWNALLSGAADLLSLETAAAEFLDTIRAIAKGGYVVEREFLSSSHNLSGSISMSRELSSELQKLDDSQRKQLSNFLEGLSDFENAKRLDIAKLRVSQLIRKLMEVGSLQSRNQLAIVLREFKL